MLYVDSFIKPNKRYIVNNNITYREKLRNWEAKKRVQVYPASRWTMLLTQRGQCQSLVPPNRPPSPGYYAEGIGFSHQYNQGQPRLRKKWSQLVSLLSLNFMGLYFALWKRRVSGVTYYHPLFEAFLTVTLKIALTGWHQRYTWLIVY